MWNIILFVKSFFHFEKHDVLWVLYMKILQLQLVTDANESLTINHIQKINQIRIWTFSTDYCANEKFSRFCVFNMLMSKCKIKFVKQRYQNMLNITKHMKHYLICQVIFLFRKTWCHLDLVHEDFAIPISY
jgi:hypothetical protein